MYTQLNDLVLSIVVIFLVVKVGMLIFMILYVLYLSTLQINSKFEFTNIKCSSLDKKFNDCYLKSVNRCYKYLSAKCNLFQTPITKVNLSLFKRFNGYRPFMFNVTADACRFLKNRNSNSIINYWYRVVENYCNFNHTCPFSDDLIIEQLPVTFVDYQFTEVLPFPTGDYLLETSWIAYDIKTP
ncbi:uncharacterized protein LOC108086784 [Drosophila ficusphila]|uniref:uncharacterized protein LOC108086784 n=1 Tax=Drosophila ficusphila TaxID=30025 RepID=UPI0007E66590|nr:uncharacterized protein LOC108086784 [Drosophila ficusphila]